MVTTSQYREKSGERTMAEAAPAVPVEQLLEAACEKYKETFGSSPTAAGIAPGRVNIIGEHTDYNEGFVFPMALSLCTVVVGGIAPDTVKCRVLTTAQGADLPLCVEFNCPTPEAPLTRSESPSWVNYVKGVVANFHVPVPGFQAVIVSSVPMGGGLSSSAALEVSTYSFLEELLKTPADRSAQ
ncbi:GHMP kinase N-terminal domain [Trinorchestia longiramus]|nr:GHMP kinase N-terminal domain [Trinorchestia longiramus]